MKMDLQNTEIWKDIIGYETLYQVSNQGNVRSVCRQVSHYLSKLQNIKGYNLKQNSNNGYKGVKLYKNGKGVQFLVHRLVAIHFIPNPDNKPEVNHKFGDKNDNSINGLEWNTASENQKHANATGLRKPPIYWKHKTGDLHTASRSVNQLDMNGNFIMNFGAAAEAQRFLKIDASAILKCAKGLLKQAGGYKWKYVAVKKIKKYGRK